MYGQQNSQCSWTTPNRQSRKGLTSNRIILILLLQTFDMFGQWNYQKRFDSLYRVEKYDLLVKEINKELKMNPKSEHALRGLGYVYIAMKDLESGEKYYSDALKVKPNCGMCYLNIGRIYSLKGKNAEALKYFDKAIEVDPGNAVLYAHRARLKEYSGDNFRAILDYNKAIALAPDKAEFYIQRGQHNEKQNYLPSAIVDFTKAIELDSTNFLSFFERAGVYYRQKKYDDAYADLTRAIAIDSNQYSLYTGRGALFEVNNEHDKAIKDYSKAISLNPNDYLPYLNRANSLYKLERVDDACNDYVAAQERFRQAKLTEPAVLQEITGSISDLCDSTRPSYYYQRGIAFYNLQDYQSALAAYDRGLVHFSNNSMILSFRGNALLALEKYEKAIESYTLSLRYKDNYSKEVDENPRFLNATTSEKEEYFKASMASTYYSIAESQLYLGQFDQSLIHINKALELGSGISSLNREAYYNLRGRLNLSKGNNDLAIADFNKSISINKDFPAAYVNRAIAGVNAITKPRKKQVGGGIQYRNHDAQTNWTTPRKDDKAAISALTSALQDCDKAIEADKDFAFAYYVRGQIKQMLAHDDYCMDLLKAKSLEMIVEDELMSGCK